ncbi:MAG: alpha/beta hydrolase [Sphingomicrobium sp.]
MPESQPALDFVKTGDGLRLAYRLRPATAPTLVFLPGYASDMDGTKALALDAYAASRGVGLLRFDYSGTGSSGGAFEDGTLSGWLAEALELVERLVDSPLILVGSSMGAWIALHLALRLPHRVEALVGIAAAPDFTEWGYTSEQQAALRRNGRYHRPNPYGGNSQLTTLALWQSGQELRLLDGPIAIDCPVRLVHGAADRDVPLAIPTKLMDQLRSADVQLNILKGGGHRLSEPHEIDVIVRTVAALLEPQP